MTREHKLALIVGFSLVLVLTVLVSDHFSKARQVEMDEKTGIATASRVGAMPVGLRLNTGPTMSLDQPASGGLGQPSALAAAPQRALPGVNPAPLTAPRSGISDPTLDIPGPDRGTDVASADQAGVRAAQGGPAVLNPAQPNTFGPSNAALHPDVRPNVPASNIGQPMNPAGPFPGTVYVSPNAGQPNGLMPAGGAAPGPQIPMKRHDVREGDSIFGIARQQYGDGNLWEKLREYNKDRVGPKGELREGVTLLLPPKDVLLGKPYTPPASSPSGPQNADPARPAGKPVTDPLKSKPDTRVVDAQGEGSKVAREYTIQSGDTLAAVAKKTLGSSKRWPELVDANPRIDPESLAVGTKIKIPDAKR